MQDLLRDFKDGLSAYGTAISLSSKLGLWKFYLLPGVISIALGALVLLGANAVGGAFAEFISVRYPWEFGAEVVRRVGKFLSQLIILAGAFMAYKYVILILVSPFMSPLSEKVEKYLCGQEDISARITLASALHDFLRGLRLGLRNIVRELFFTLGLLILGLFPVVGLFTSAGIFVLQAFYAGFGNMDYTLERHYGVRGSVEFVRDYKGLAVGNGLIFLLILMIPVIGLFLAPTLATIAATVETVDRLDQEHELDLMNH